MNSIIDESYHKIKQDKNEMNNAINNLCKNISKLTEIEIIKFLVVLNTRYKISDDDIIDCSLTILSNIIKSKDHSYNIEMKTCIDNILIINNNKYYSKFVNNIYSQNY